MLILRQADSKLYMKNATIAFLIIAAGIITFANGAFAKESEEAKFGCYTDKAILSTRVILANKEINDRVRQIGERIAKNSDRPDLSYTFRILNDPTINAYSAAGGFIYINTGLLDILGSEDELAAMIAHELVHTDKRHQIKYINDMQNAELGSLAADTVLGVGIGAVTGIATQAALAAITPPASAFTQASQESSRPGRRIRPGANPNPFYTTMVNNAQGEVTGRTVGVGICFGGALGNELVAASVRGYGKKQEFEADTIAIRYIKRAGYDPHALISGFKRLMAVRNSLGITNQNYISSLINAEPGLEERVKNAEDVLKPGGAS